MILDTKMVNDQGKGDETHMMIIQTVGMFAFGVTEFVKIFIQSLLCEETSMV